MAIGNFFHFGLYLILGYWEYIPWQSCSYSYCHWQILNIEYIELLHFSFSGPILHSTNLIFLEIYFSTSSGFAVAAAIFMRWKLFKTSEAQSFWNQFLSPAENTIPYHFKFYFSEKTKYWEEVLVITQRGATTANHLMVWNSGELAFQHYILPSQPWKWVCILKSWTEK